MRRVVFGLPMLVVTLGCVPAFAVDGVVLINQSGVLAGNITPGDTPGFPVTISQPGSYRLSGNLTVPDVNTTAILVTAENVSLDLNGFSVTGPNTCTFGTGCPFASGEGVMAGNFGVAGPRNVRVFNGTVRGMGANGIILTGVGSAVEKVVAMGNREVGIEVEAGSVVDSVASFNEFGIFAKTARGCITENNTQTGIEVFANGVASGNSANNNSISGITLAVGGTATGNTANHNSDGIVANCPSTVVGNTATGNQVNIEPIVITASLCTLANNSQ